MSHFNVYVRFRPVFYNPDEEPEKSCVRACSTTSVEMINLRNTQKTIEYSFEQVFSEDSTQEEVFGTVVQPNLCHFTEDLHNVSIFAYGPTGSGKTFTILGADDSPGFIPRTMKHLFVQSRKSYLRTDTTATFSMSYIEVYQEKVYDLLNKSRKIDCIQQDKHGIIVLPDLTETVIESFSQFEDLFLPSSKNRRVAKTNVNERSSRSHAILQIKLTTHQDKHPHKKKIAKLSIIDLAGSEDNRRTGNKGTRLKESSSINTSLLVLGKVVDSLGKKSVRIPYRDSKLTRLLQDSLGGTAHTCMVVNLSPEMSSIFDTHRALTFAVKSKSIVNRPFTYECKMKPSELHDLQLSSANSKGETENHIEDKENAPLEPLFSPFIREKARKRKLQLEKFDGLESTLYGLTGNPSNPSSRNQKSQQHLIENIRKSVSAFKMLKQKPEDERLAPSSASTSCEKQTSPPKKAHVFTTSAQVFTVIPQDQGFKIEVKSATSVQNNYGT